VTVFKEYAKFLSKTLNVKYYFIDLNGEVLPSPYFPQKANWKMIVTVQPRVYGPYILSP
jgi:hypothetical protein